VEAVYLEPAAKAFDIDLVADPVVAEGHTTALLVISDDNPGMVIIGIAGEVVGAIPADLAPAWHDFAGRLAAEGLVPQIEAVVRDRHGEISIGLYADPEADYRTPGEALAERTQRSRARVSRLHARATGRCRDCGEPIEPTGRGRPPVRCASCRAGTATTVPAILASVPWPHEPATTDWSVLDIETTGLWPSVDRIVEIGVVRLAPDGQEIASWTTLVDPDRDVGASEIHGLTAFDLRGAPRFRDLAPSLLAMLAGTRLAAHNALFDTNFLSCEFARAGLDWGMPDALDTMSAVSRLGLTGSRRLDAVCADLGIPHPDEHCALIDARATSGLLTRVLSRLDETPCVVPWLMDAPVPPPSRLRTDPAPPRLDTSLGAIADRVGVPDGLGISDTSAQAYLSLLDRVLEDRKITDHEVSALASLAGEWGIGGAAVRSLHAAYLGGVWDLARADGIITDAESRDLAILAELLGVAPDEPDTPAIAAVAHAEDLTGKSVCFTGASVVTVRGLSLERDDQERFAAEAGMIVKGNVSRKCDILVLADPDSRSGKSKLADELGVRKIAEPVFWRMLGVPID
jgi:DNA polymerase III subunit epsilon